MPLSGVSATLTTPSLLLCLFFRNGVSGTNSRCRLPGVSFTGVRRTFDGVFNFTAFRGLFLPKDGSSSKPRFLLTIFTLLTAFFGDLDTAATLDFLALVSFFLVTMRPVVPCCLPCLFSRLVGARLIDRFCGRFKEVSKLFGRAVRLLAALLSKL